MTAVVRRDVTDLRNLLQEDLAARSHPEFGGQPLWANLSAAAGHALHELIEWIAQHRPAIYGAFADADQLLEALADAAERLADEPWDLDALLAATATDVDVRWVVTMPLVNVAVPGGVILLDDQLALAPASDYPRTSVDARCVARRLQEAFGAPASAGSRYIHGADDKLLDTRRTASLVSLERGSRGHSRRRALEQGRLLVAGWTLLSPPQGAPHTPLWPEVTEWQPQPFFLVEAAMHRVDADGTVTKRPGAVFGYDDDEIALWPWPDQSVLKRVLNAVRAAEFSRSACALLSAAWNLYLAARSPSDLPWIDRLVYTMHAREALCEPVDRDAQTVDRRFTAVCDRMDVISGLRDRGWGPGDLAQLNGPLKRLRNLGVHGADVSLLRLGYPPGRRRINVDSERLAGIYVREAVSPAYHAVRGLTTRLWDHMDEAGYNDRAFEDCFTIGV